MRHLQDFAELVTGVKEMRKSAVLFLVFLIAFVALVLRYAIPSVTTTEELIFMGSMDRSKSLAFDCVEPPS